MSTEPSPGSCWSSLRKRRRKSISCGDSANTSQYIIVLWAVVSVAGILLALFQPLSLISHLFFISLLLYSLSFSCYLRTRVHLCFHYSVCCFLSFMFLPVLGLWQLWWRCVWKAMGQTKQLRSLIYIVTHVMWVLCEPKLAKMFSKRYLQCLRT